MAVLVALCCAFFAAVVAVMPALKGGGYSAASDSISEGALGRHGWLQAAAFVVLGAGSLLLAYVVRDAWEGSRGSAAVVLLAVWGVAVLLCAVFPVDEGARGATAAAKVHLAAALLGFLLVLVAMWLATFAFRGDDPWADWFTPSLVVCALASVAFVVTGAAPQSSSWGGYAQRGFVAVVLVWLAGVALVAA